MLTRAKVCYNLHNTPYQLQVNYGEQEVTFCFSSNLYKDKFIEKLSNHRKEINNSISKRFGVTIKADFIADLRLYTSIEKRGFLLLIDGVKVECQNNIILDGLKMIARN